MSNNNDLSQIAEQTTPLDVSNIPDTQTSEEIVPHLQDSIPGPSSTNSFGQPSTLPQSHAGTTQDSLLDSMSALDENQMTAKMNRAMNRGLETKSNAPSASDLSRLSEAKGEAVADKGKKEKLLNRLSKKSTDQVIELAEYELNKSGVTLYGHNGPINLTPLQHKFVIGYVKSGSVKEAITYAGVKTSNKMNIGYTLLNDPKVAEAIAVMEKQHILASGLTELEVIAGIRDITMLARENKAYTAALKGFAMLGDYLGIFDESKARKRASKDAQPGGLTIKGDVFITNTGDQKDALNDVKKLAESLGISIQPGTRPEVLRDITAESILAEESKE